MRVSIEVGDNRQLWIEADRSGEYVLWADVLPIVMAAATCSDMFWQEWRDQTGLPDAVCKVLQRVCGQAEQLTAGVTWSDVLEKQ